jgi:tetratricopeptide (TPR) repeat protein
MRKAHNLRGILEQEGAALALARDVRGPYHSAADAILSARERARDFSKAIAYHTQDLEIAKEVGDRAGEGQTYGNLGNAHDSMGAYTTRNLEIAREVGDRAGEGMAYGGLGNAHHSLGDFSQAIAYHTQHL